ncbi:MAG: hypothetical protein ACT4PL_10175 [Phycisphaerales bacterium]
MSLAIVHLNEARRQMDTGGIAPIWMPKNSGYTPCNIRIDEIIEVHVPQSLVDEVLYEERRGKFFLASFLIGIAAIVLTFCSLHYVVDQTDYFRAGVRGAIALVLWVCAIVAGKWKPKRDTVRALSEKQHATVRADVLKKEAVNRQLSAGWPSLSVSANSQYDTPKAFLADLVRLKTEIHDWVSDDGKNFRRS